MLLAFMVTAWSWEICSFKEPKVRTFQQPILVLDLALTNPCESEERARDLLTNVDLTVLVLKA